MTALTRREAEDRDPLLLHRSAAFPNLGLLFNRRGYDRLWRNASLSYHTNGTRAPTRSRVGWDHWVRQSAAAQDLECVFPALLRAAQHGLQRRAHGP